LRTRAVISVLVFAGAMTFLAGCRPKAAAPVSPPTFSVMTYNLARYNLDDRDGDGQFNDPKPETERKAVWEVIAAENPDILAVQEIGNPTIFEEFRYGLKSRGMDYPHAAYLERGQSELNMAVLSRFPISQTWQHLDDRYSMGEAQLPVLRGFLECEIAIRTNYQLRLIVAHLKSKVFHQLGQTEMRRNEARLLNKLVRMRLRENPDINLLVVGDMNDTYNSAAFRELAGNKQEFLADLRPKDIGGDVWTRYEAAEDSYTRIDYLLAAEGLLPEYIAASSRVVRHPAQWTASDHRPVVGVFWAEDKAPRTTRDSAAPASSYLPATAPTMTE
jgi:endonuclease/exonuclease/phosphatase family metal-dependent hydrolase